MLQVCDHILHTAVTTIYTFLCTFQNDLLQTVRKVRCIHTWRDHLFLQMLDSDRHSGISVKRNSSCDHLIQCDSKRIDIALLIAVSASHLLR